MKLSKHSRERLEERTGLSLKSHEKLAQKAWEEGLTHAQSKGNLHRYLTGLFHKGNGFSEVRVWADKVWLFGHQQTLITVFHLPANLKKLAANCKPILFPNRDQDKAVIRFNGANPCILCSQCRVILRVEREGTLTEEDKAAIRGEKWLAPQYCETCKPTTNETVPRPTTESPHGGNRDRG